MGALKKGLDKFDLGTPLVAKAFGGTADYGESAKARKRKTKAISEANMGKVEGKASKGAVKSNMLT
jgi:hypothetical protein